MTQYANPRQGISCEHLRAILREATAQERSWVAVLSRLQPKLAANRRQIANLKRQADNTGDHESFAAEIRALENENRRLEREISTTQNKLESARLKASDARSEMAIHRC